MDNYKKYFKIFLSVLGLVIVGVAFFILGSSLFKNQEENQEEEKYTARTEEVRFASYFQTYNTNGELIAENATGVSTRYGGVVEEILVKEGDYVSTDQELFKYAKAGGENEAELAVRQAEIGLDSARDNLASAQSAAYTAKLNASQGVQMSEQALETTREESGLAVSQAEESYNATKANYDQLVQSNQKSIELAEQSVQLSQIAYDSAVDSRQNIEASGNLSTEHVEEQARMIPLQVWPSIQTSLVTADQIMGVSNVYKHENDVYENNLKARDSGRYLGVYLDVEKLLRESEQKNLEDLDEDASLEEIKELENFAIRLKNTLNGIGELLDRAIVGSSFTESQRSALRANVSLAQQNTEVARQTIQSIVQALESTDLNTDIQLTNARYAETQAEANLMRARTTLESTRAQTAQAESSAKLSLIAAENGLESAKTSRDNRIEQAELSLSNARTNYNLVVTQQDSAVNSARNAVENAENSLANVKNNYFGQLERAPVEGYLVNFNVEVGQSLGRGMSFASIVQTEELKAKFTVPTELSAAVKEGTKGKVECAGEKEVEAEVDLVSITAGSGHNVKVEAVLADDSTDYCKIGELVDVTLEIEREEALQVPAEALTWMASNPVVWVVKEDKTIDAVRIQVEQILDDKIIVSEGISEGELVIVNPAEDFTRGQTVELKQD